MRHLKHVKYALVVIQIFLIAGAFLFFFGFIAMTLYVLGELSIAEIVEYLAVATTWEGISILTFLEGLIWTFFKHRVK